MSKKYILVQIEAKQANGEWWVRSALLHENYQVIRGEKSREWLIAQANRAIVQWVVNYGQVKQLRISGIK